MHIFIGPGVDVPQEKAAWRLSREWSADSKEVKRHWPRKDVLVCRALTNFWRTLSGAEEPVRQPIPLSSGACLGAAISHHVSRTAVKEATERDSARSQWDALGADGTDGGRGRQLRQAEHSSSCAQRQPPHL
eukprot:scaffold1063_cov316-Pinguiococcus_pyrenoidosus.AAC.1